MTTFSHSQDHHAKDHADARVIETAMVRFREEPLNVGTPALRRMWLRTFDMTPNALTIAASAGRIDDHDLYDTDFAKVAERRQVQAVAALGHLYDEWAARQPVPEEAPVVALPTPTLAPRRSLWKRMTRRNSPNA